MRVFHSAASVLHAPDLYYRRGAMVSHPEQASRYSILHGAVAAAGHALAAAGDFGRAPLVAVHTPDYVEFLATAWARRAEVPGMGQEIGSSQFARPHMSRRPSGVLGPMLSIRTS